MYVCLLVRSDEEMRPEFRLNTFAFGNCWHWIGKKDGIRLKNAKVDQFLFAYFSCMFGYLSCCCCCEGVMQPTLLNFLIFFKCCLERLCHSAVFNAINARFNSHLYGLWNQRWASWASSNTVCHHNYSWMSIKFCGCVSLPCCGSRQDFQQGVKARDMRMRGEKKIIH